MQDMNPELLFEAVAKGVGNLERGVTDYSAWSRLMVYQFGDLIHPHLENLWAGAQAEWQSRQAAMPPIASIDGPPLIPCEPPPAPRKANYLVRHWRGELPLPVSYWLNGFLACVLIAFAANVVSGPNESASLNAVVIRVILLYVVSLAVSVWQIVGTWRSASRHVGRGGSAGWAGLAKVLLVLGAVNLVRLTAFTTVPQIVEFSNILAGDKKIPPYEIRVLPGGTEVEFRGGIRAGSAKELERVLAAVPQVKVLHVNSMGGRIREGEQMARLVRERGLITYTSEECLSAATLVFIAGKERVVSARAKIGFHQSSLPGMTHEQRRASDDSLRHTMRLAGVSDGFISRVLATRPESMWYPSMEEMRRAGVITSESFGERFAASGEILRSSSPQDIDKVWGAMPGFRAIKEIEPDTYWTIVGDVSAAIQSGKTMTEVQRIARRTAERLVLKYLPAASDEALRSTRDGWVDLLEQFKDKDSKACIAIFSPRSAPPDFNYGRILSEAGNTNYLAVLDKVLRSAAQGVSPRLNTRTAEEDLAQIRSGLSLIYGDDLDLMAKQYEWMEHSERVCEMLLAYYRATQKIPQQRQGNLLRYLLSDASRSPSRPQQAAPAVTSTAQPDPANGPGGFKSFADYTAAFDKVAREAAQKRNEEAEFNRLIERLARSQDAKNGFR
jgi:hypothetical protein